MGNLCCAREHSDQFFVQFFVHSYTAPFKLECMGPFRVYGAFYSVYVTQLTFLCLHSEHGKKLIHELTLSLPTEKLQYTKQINVNLQRYTSINEVITAVHYKLRQVL
jgi:hypothetical protein